MRTRRIAGLAATALLLHLNVSRADAACGRHAASSSADAHATAHAGGHASHHATADASSSSRPSAGAVSESERCDEPVQADCCATPGSCSVTVVAADAREHALPVSGDAQLCGLRLTPPTRHRVPPEPPPPRG